MATTENINFKYIYSKDMLKDLTNFEDGDLIACQEDHSLHIMMDGALHSGWGPFSGFDNSDPVNPTPSFPPVLYTANATTIIPENATYMNYYVFAAGEHGYPNIKLTNISIPQQYPSDVTLQNCTILGFGKSGAPSGLRKGKLDVTAYRNSTIEIGIGESVCDPVTKMPQNDKLISYIRGEFEDVIENNGSHIDSNIDSLNIDIAHYVPYVYIPDISYTNLDISPKEGYMKYDVVDLVANNASYFTNTLPYNYIQSECHNDYVGIAEFVDVPLIPQNFSHGGAGAGLACQDITYETNYLDGSDLVITAGQPGSYGAVVIQFS